jgi:hypothetical protein
VKEEILLSEFSDYRFLSTCPIPDKIHGFRFLVCNQEEENPKNQYLKGSATTYLRIRMWGLINHW